MPGRPATCGSVRANARRHPDRTAFARVTWAPTELLPLMLPSKPASNSPSTWAADARSGFLVFLIALPLCLAIAKASDFPPIAGVMTAIIGGLIATPLGSAKLTIKGPAAGLIVIVVGAVAELGGGDVSLGYHRTLAVGVVAAGLQILFALLRTASIGMAMAPSVVHGMLAAIGIIIISKQTHVLLGVAPTAKAPLPLLAEIPHSISACNPVILCVGLVALAIVFLWPLLRASFAKKVPAQLVALFVVVPLGLFFGLTEAHEYTFGSEIFRIDPKSVLVQLPASLLDAVTAPDFSVVFSPTSLKYIAMFALVGTIESTLSCLAVDSLDPAKRASNLDRDLLALGVGNLVSAAVGGLPMISEIVRSKANIDAGAKSSKSNLFHGLFLLLFVVLLPGLLQLIPQAALAAMLIAVGWRLGGPQHWTHAWHLGKDQFLLFATTVVLTLVEDLLIGVAAGLVLKVLLHLLRGAGVRGLLSPRVETEKNDGELRIVVHNSAAFTSLLRVRKAFHQADESTRSVTLDLTHARIVDHTFLQRVHGMADEIPNATFRIVGMEGMTSMSDNAFATQWRSKR